MTVRTCDYLLRELDTVVGLVSKNGTLVEAYDYDAYGQVRIWGYRPFDYNRDGDVDTAPAFCCSANDPGLEARATLVIGIGSQPGYHPLPSSRTVD